MERLRKAGRKAKKTTRLFLTESERQQMRKENIQRKGAGFAGGELANYEVKLIESMMKKGMSLEGAASVLVRARAMDSEEIGKRLKANSATFQRRSDESLEEARKKYHAEREKNVSKYVNQLIDMGVEEKPRPKKGFKFWKRKS